MFRLFVKRKASILSFTARNLQLFKYRKSNKNNSSKKLTGVPNISKAISVMGRALHLKDYSKFKCTRSARCFDLNLISAIKIGITVDQSAWCHSPPVSG
jgi:hypothetical protein